MEQKEEVKRKRYRLFTKVPKYWATVRNYSVALAASMTALMTLDLDLPEQVTEVASYVLAAATVLATFAQTATKNE